MESSLCPSLWAHPHPPHAHRTSSWSGLFALTESPQQQHQHQQTMDAYVGNWKSGPGDYENFEAYAKVLNQPELTKDMNKGADVVITKDGDKYILVSSQGGVTKLKEIFHPDGTIEFLDSHIPSDMVKVTHRFEDGKVKVEGTVAGMETKSAMSLVDGKFILEIETKGVVMKTRHSKV